MSPAPSSRSNGDPGEKPADAPRDRRSLRRAIREGAKGQASGQQEATVPTEPLMAELLTELRAERSQVLDPMLHRLADLGYRLREGKDVAIPLLEEGLQLLHEYIEHLHDVHIRQFAQAGPSDEHPEVCMLPLAEIELEPERAERRLASVRAVLAGYRSGFAGYRKILGVDLRNEARAELSWEGFSEDYAKTCLPRHLTPDGLRKWEAALSESKAEYELLHGKVLNYLERTQGLVLPGSPGEDFGGISGLPSKR